MNKKLYIVMAAAALTVGATSCSDFLDEDNKTGTTAQTEYVTESGLKGLVASTYSFARGWYGKEPALGLAEMGTDLFYYGFDCKQKSLVSYNFGAESLGNNVQNNPCLDQYWELFYNAVDVCNNAIEQVHSTKINSLTTKDRQDLVAQAFFMRSLYYFNMVNMWGAIPYNETHIDATNRTKSPVRKPENEVYGRILADLDSAITNFDNAGSYSKANGKANYWAARALKARVLLYAASWLGGQLNEQVADNDHYSSMTTADLYQAASDEADAVIDNSYASFYDNYDDVWCMENESYVNNNEALFGIVYDEDMKTNVNCIPYRYSRTTSGGWENYNSLITRTGYSRGGNAMLLMFVSKWNNGCADLGGNGRKNTNVFLRVSASNHSIQSASTGNNVDVMNAYSPYGRGFCRYVPSLRLWQLLEEHASTDQRARVTLQDHYDIGSPDLSKNAKNYPELQDTAIFYSVLDGNSAEGKALQAWAKNRYRIQFASNGDIPVYTSSDPALAEPTVEAKPVSDVYGDNRYNSVMIGGWQSYPGIRKFLDYFQTSSAATAYNSQYPTNDISSRDFIVIRLPEMYLIKAEAQLALGNEREARNALNSIRRVRAIEGTNNTISRSEPITLDKILDERAIELCGEYQRWFDLKRTGKLYEYVHKYNHQASQALDADATHHYLYRPIPQEEIDAVQNMADSTNTDYTKYFWQNPGY